MVHTIDYTRNALERRASLHHSTALGDTIMTLVTQVTGRSSLDVSRKGSAAIIAEITVPVSIFCNFITERYDNYRRYVVIK